MSFAGSSRMARIILLAAVIPIATLFYLGCSSGSGGGTCTDYDMRGGAQGAEFSNACISMGGQCGGRTGTPTGCPSGMHPAPDNSGLGQACSGSPYGADSVDRCGAKYAPTDEAVLAVPCCVPNDDAGLDGAADASLDAANPIGSCAEETCNAGCSCGVLPQDGRPHCLCLGKDASVDGSDDAAAPNCGTIYCFSGCSCSNRSQSSCSCP